MTTRPRRKKEGPAKAALIAALENLLGTAMGTRLPTLERLIGSRDAVPLALAWLLVYSAGAGLALWWANDGRPPEGAHAKFASIIFWGALHFPALIVITRLLTIRVLDIARRDILPFASESYAACVRTALAERFASRPVRLAPYAVAAIAVAASLWAIRAEIEPVWWPARHLPPDLLFWAAASYFLAFLEMRVVVTAQFPRAFAAGLDQDRHCLYPLRAADSPLVRGLARLNRTVLSYWVLVFLVWASVMLLILLPKSFALATDSPYVFVLVPFVGFFSLGLGAYAYLASESAIATALRRDSLERARELQREIAALLDRGGDETVAARLDRLTRLHDQIIEGGRYGSRFGKTVSLVLPLALPAIGVIERLFGQRAG